MGSNKNCAPKAGKGKGMKPELAPAPKAKKGKGK